MNHIPKQKKRKKVKKQPKRSKQPKEKAPLETHMAAPLKGD